MEANLKTDGMGLKLNNCDTISKEVEKEVDNDEASAVCQSLDECTNYLSLPLEDKPGEGDVTKSDKGFTKKLGYNHSMIESV